VTGTTDEMQELAEIRALAREFAAAELRPHVERWDTEAGLPDSTVAQLGELGFFGMLVPETYGGMGFDAATFAAAIEELAWGEPAAALVLVAHAAACAWLHEQRDAVAKEWLGPLAAGERVATVTTAGVSTAAAANDRVSGVASWLARPRGAVLGVIGAGGGDERYACPLDGATLAPPHATMGLRALGLADARLDDTPLLTHAARPALGDACDRIGRIGVAAVATGIADAALEHAAGYAAVREQFGRPIRSFEGIAVKLGEMRVRTAAARALTARAAHDPGAEGAAMAKIFAADAAMWVTTQAVQIFGGYGYMRDYPVEKLMRDAKAAALFMGESDALRITLAG
jgi:alkylation response protein AidB-like acyl-CoA dehydrogenase